MNIQSHLLQISCLALRRLSLDEDGKALECQVACMQASLRRSLAHFGDT